MAPTKMKTNKPLFSWPVAGGVFAPFLLPLLLCLVALSILLWLGNWQWQRHLEKTAWLAATRQPTFQSSPLQNGSEITSHLFQQVEIQGTLLQDSDFYWLPKKEGGVQGAYVLSALRLPDETYLWTIRGFLPQNYQTDGQSLALQQKNNWRGVLLPAPRQNSWTPPPNLLKRHFYAPDIKTLSALLPAEARAVSTVPALFVLSEAASPLTIVPADHVLPLKNPHLGYAITWIGLAVAMALFFLLASYRKPDIAK
jgi:surfeit locus 1 family protein